MKIIAISLFYKPIWPGFGTRTPELVIDQLANLGNKIILFTGRIPKEKQNEKKYGSKKIIEKIGNGEVEINRLWTPKIKHEGLFNRIIIYFIFLLQCYFQILFSQKIKLAFLLHPYPLFFHSILLLTKFKKIKTIIMQADLWPDNLWELKVVKSKTLYSIFKKITIDAFRLSDCIMVITKELKTQMKKYPIAQSKIQILELATDIELFKPISILTDNYPGKFVTLYNGIFSTNYDFNIILESAEILKDHDILFLIAGGGELHDYLINEIKKRNLKNVIMKEPLPKIEDVVKRLNQADVLLLGMRDTLQGRSAHPSKLFEFMACGKPIICSGKGAPIDLISLSKGGITVEVGDARSFADAILKLKESKVLREKMGENSRTFIVNHYSQKVFREKLSLLLNAIT